MTLLGKFRPKNGQHSTKKTHAIHKIEDFGKVASPGVSSSGIIQDVTTTAPFFRTDSHQTLASSGLRHYLYKKAYCH